MLGWARDEKRSWWPAEPCTRARAELSWLSLGTTKASTAEATWREARCTTSTDCPILTCRQCTTPRPRRPRTPCLESPSSIRETKTLFTGTHCSPYWPSSSRNVSWQPAPPGTPAWRGAMSAHQSPSMKTLLSSANRYARRNLTT